MVGKRVKCWAVKRERWMVDCWDSKWVEMWANYWAGSRLICG